MTGPTGVYAVTPHRFQEPPYRVGDCNEALYESHMASDSRWIFPPRIAVKIKQKVLDHVLPV